MSVEDIVDGLVIIQQKRGRIVDQGDVEMLAIAIKELRKGRAGSQTRCSEADQRDAALEEAAKVVEARDSYGHGGYIAAAKIIRALKRQSDKLRPPKPAECAIQCPPKQVCDHCQWPSRGGDEEHG